MTTKKIIAICFLSMLVLGAIFLPLTFANSSLTWVSKLGLMTAAGLSGIPFFLANKVESISFKLLLTWIGRFGMWLFLGYLLYAQWRWPESLILPTIFLPFDWWTIHKAKEKRLELLAAQNLPPMNFNLK